MIIDYQLTIMTGKVRVTIIYNRNTICRRCDVSAYLPDTNSWVDFQAGTPHFGLVEEDVAR